MIPRLVILAVNSGTHVFLDGKAIRGDIVDLTYSARNRLGELVPTLKMEMATGSLGPYAEEPDFFQMVDLLKQSDWVDSQKPVGLEVANIGTMKQAFKEATKEMGGIDGREINVTMEIDGTKFGELVHECNGKISECTKKSSKLPGSLESVVVDIPNKVFTVNGVSFDTSHNFNMSFENGCWYVSVEIPNTFKAAHWCKYDVNGKLISDENTGYVE